MIVQNFRRKPDTPMAEADEPGLVELMSACAIARLVMGPADERPGPAEPVGRLRAAAAVGHQRLGRGLPLTPDFVNPEAPWPEIGRLERLCLDAGYALRERLTIYPEYLARDEFLHPDMRERVRAMAGADGLARDEAPRPLAGVAS